MLHKTKGIILQHQNYSETSVIIRVYTENFGLLSFIIKGVRKKGAKIKNSILQNLSLVEIVFYQNARAGLKNLKEIKSSYQPSSIPFDIKKSSIIIFLNEILHKTLKEETHDKDLFDFIFNSIIIFDKATENFSDFHFHFLIGLTKYLGFYPNNNYSEINNNFNIREGHFQPFISDSSVCIANPLSSQMHLLLTNNFGEYYVPSGVRKELLNTLIDYYKTHISGITIVKSNEVLEMVLN